MLFTLFLYTFYFIYLIQFIFSHLITNLLLQKVTPSPCLPYNILNVLAAYVWTVRLFNGDHQDSSQDATEAILTLSSVLASGASYEEAALAVESPKMEAQNVSFHK